MNEQDYNKFKQELIDVIKKYEQKYQIEVQSISILKPTDIDMVINKK